MAKNKQIHFKMHGLKKDTDDLVSPSTFGKKLMLLEKALKQMDQNANGEKGYNYRIKDLKIGSVEIVLEEIPQHPLPPPKRSGIEEFHSFAAKVSKLDSASFDFSNKVMLETLKDLCIGIEKSFSHAEIGVEGENSTKIILDKTFQNKAKKTVEDMEKGLPLFRGTVYENRDGYLKEVDLRKDLRLAKLILFFNEIELQCHCKSIPIETLRASLNKAVTVSAKATYDGINRLPTILDLINIEILSEPKDLTEWQGKIEIPFPERGDL